MKVNESSADRATRVFTGIAALSIAVAGLGLLNGEPVGITIAVIGVVVMITGFTGFCPAYLLVGTSTCTLQNQKD